MAAAAPLGPTRTLAPMLARAARITLAVGLAANAALLRHPLALVALQAVLAAIVLAGWGGTVALALAALVLLPVPAAELRRALSHVPLACDCQRTNGRPGWWPAAAAVADAALVGLAVWLARRRVPRAAVGGDVGRSGWAMTGVTCRTVRAPRRPRPRVPLALSASPQPAFRSAGQAAGMRLLTDPNFWIRLGLPGLLTAGAVVLTARWAAVAAAATRRRAIPVRVEVSGRRRRP